MGGMYDDYKNYMDKLQIMVFDCLDKLGVKKGSKSKDGDARIALLFTALPVAVYLDATMIAHHYIFDDLN